MENNKYKVIEITSPYKLNGANTDRKLGFVGVIKDFEIGKPLKLYNDESQKEIQVGRIKSFKEDDDLLIVDATYFNYVLKRV